MWRWCYISACYLPCVLCISLLLNHPHIFLTNYSIQLFHCVMFYSFRTPLIKLNKLSEETGMYTNTDTKVCLIHLCTCTCVLMVHVWIFIICCLIISVLNCLFCIICALFSLRYFVSWIVLYLECTIAVKAENLNPGGSVKDRAALYLVKDAEEKGTHMHNSLSWIKS